MDLSLSNALALMSHYKFDFFKRILVQIVTRFMVGCIKILINSCMQQY